jgi:hypothetical protein
MLHEIGPMGLVARWGTGSSQLVLPQYHSVIRSKDGSGIEG